MRDDGLLAPKVVSGSPAVQVRHPMAPRLEDSVMSRSDSEESRCVGRDVPDGAGVELEADARLHAPDARRCPGAHFLQSPPTDTEPSLHSVKIPSLLRRWAGEEAGEGEEASAS